MAFSRLKGAIGGSYQPQAYKADVQRTLNLVPEVIESQEGENSAYASRRPGLNIFCQGIGTTGQAIYADPVGSRVFYVTGTDFRELYADGSDESRGTVADSTVAVPPYIVGNGQGQQLFITSGGLGYVYDLNSNTLDAISTDDLISDLVQACFIDGYVLVLNAYGVLQWSAIQDCATWDPLDVAERSTMGDPWVGMTVLHRELRLFGEHTAEAWVDVGDPLLPFQLVQGSVNEQGIAGRNTLAVIANTVAWVGENVQGHGIVWSAGGYLPQRISTHPVELALSKSVNLALARAMVIQQLGHIFYILTVPDLPTTWVYDTATTLWTEWSGTVNTAATPWVTTRWPPLATTFGFSRQLIVGNMAGYSVGTLDDTPDTSQLVAISSNAAALYIYDWTATQRAVVQLAGVEGAGATAATHIQPTGEVQSFASIRGGARVDLYAGASNIVPSATGTVDSQNSGLTQWVRTYAVEQSSQVRYLVAAGGGGSGAVHLGGITGGGGAGAVLEGHMPLGVGTYQVTVGLGGGIGVAGSDSDWNGVWALGGGAGGADSHAGENGGCGGGAGNASYVGSGGDLGGGAWQSHHGGVGSVGGDGGTDHINAAGGGGGALYTGTGEAASQGHGGNGGAALTSDISGSDEDYGGGGGGQGLLSNGSTTASAYAGGGSASAGQPGVVVLRYPTSLYTATGGDETTDGSDTIHTFETTGALVVSATPTASAAWAVACVQAVTVIPAGSFFLTGAD